MNLDIQISFGDECTAYGGCIVRIKDPNKRYLAHNHPRMLSPEYKDAEINIVRFQDRSRNFYMLLDGSAYLRYGTSEFVPIMSPYTSNNWTDYQDYWNYEDTFRVKSSSSSVFGVIHIQDPLPSNVSVKITTLDPGITTKTIYSNSHLVLFKRSNFECQIDGNNYDIMRRCIEYAVSDTKDVVFSVASKSYLVCLQSQL